MFLRLAYVTAFACALGRILIGCGDLPDDRYDFDLHYGVASAGATAARIATVGGDGKFCLDVKDQSQANGSYIQLWQCAGSDNQGFRLDGEQLRVYGDKCIRPAGGRNDDGATVRLATCDKNMASQKWSRVGKQLRWANSSRCLDVTDGDFQNGTLLQIWTCDPANVNQQFSFGGASSSPSQPVSQPSAQPTGTRFDLSKWRQETYAKGTFNDEQERYTNGNRNVEFHGDGITVITARKENGEWTSARLTGDEVGDLPAYYEAKITLPSAKGTWPAFWLTSRGAWPQGGEIDIMEQVNGDGKTHWSNHWGAHSGKPTFNTHESMGGLDLSKPHTYGGYITDKGVQFYVDGKPVGKWVTYPAESNWTKIARQMVPIVNLAMGGNWPGNIPANVGTQTMTVHWVTKSKAPPRL